MKFYLLTALGIMLISQLAAQEKSTADLKGLIGTWDIERIYGPEEESPRSMKGVLICQEALDGTFIQCTYTMERPEKPRGIDVVYFNYNSIYEKYESIWMASTWPIKVLLQGDIVESFLMTSAEFSIRNNITEYVRDEMEMPLGEAFERKTFIRTSNDEEGVWKHHMTEKATRIN